jgi:hypothetical protein
MQLKSGKSMRRALNPKRGGVLWRRPVYGLLKLRAGNLANRNVITVSTSGQNVLKGRRAVGLREVRN